MKRILLVLVATLFVTTLNAGTLHHFCYVEAQDYIFCSKVKDASSNIDEDCENWAQWWIDNNNYQTYEIVSVTDTDFNLLDEKRYPLCDYAEDWAF